MQDNVRIQVSLEMIQRENAKELSRKLHSILKWGARENTIFCLKKWELMLKIEKFRVTQGKEMLIYFSKSKNKKNQ